MWTPNAFLQAWRKSIDRVNERRRAEFVAAGGESEKFEPLACGFHELRHTYATMLLANGVRIEEVSRRLGHSSSVVTANVYSHPLDAEHRDGVEVLDSLI